MIFNNLVRLALLLFPATFHAQSASDSILISGKINLTPGWRPRLYLVRPEHFRQLISPFEGIVVDSTDVAADGSFAFLKRNFPTENHLYRLCIQPEKSRWANGIEPIWRENFAVLALPAEQPISLSANAEQFSRSYQISGGGVDNQTLVQIRNLRNHLFALAETDQKLVAARPGTTQIFGHDISDLKAQRGGVDSASILRLRERIAAENEEREQMKRFLDTTRAVAPAFLALNRLSPDAEYSREAVFFARFAGRFLASDMGGFGDWTAQFRERLGRFYQGVLPGDEMPDVAAVSEKGDTLRLANLPGKLTALFFWASDYPASRAFQKQTLVPLYQAFKKKGLTIFGFSIDQYPTEWKAALKADGADWPNVNDPRGRAADVLFELDVQEFPTVFLVDKSGKVLARNLKAAALNAFVQRYFSK